MDADLKKSAVPLIVTGLVFMPAAPIVGGLVDSGSIRHGAALLTSFGFAIFILGCIRLARAKGQPWFYGLLCFFNVIGLAILWFLVPDKSA